MRDYWRQEFTYAWDMLNEKMYLPDGYNYCKERGLVKYDEDGNEIDVLTEMISLKEQIEWDVKKGLIFNKFRFYTIKIWNLLGIEQP